MIKDYNMFCEEWKGIEMNVHLVKWGQVGFCMQTCSFSAARMGGGGGGECSRFGGPWPFLTGPSRRRGSISPRQPGSGRAALGSGGGGGSASAAGAGGGGGGRGGRGGGRGAEAPRAAGGAAGCVLRREAGAGGRGGGLGRPAAGERPRGAAGGGCASRPARLRRRGWRLGVRPWAAGPPEGRRPAARRVASPARTGVVSVAPSQPEELSARTLSPGWLVIPRYVRHHVQVAREETPKPQTQQSLGCEIKMRYMSQRDNEV